MDVALEIRGITKAFGDTKALDNLNLAVPRGATYGVIGPSGAGKTTAHPHDHVDPVSRRGHADRARQVFRARSEGSHRLPARGARRLSARCASARSCRTSGSLKGVLGGRGAKRAPRGCSTRLGLADAANEEVRGPVEGHAAARAVRRRDHQPAGSADPRRAFQRARPGERAPAEGADCGGAARGATILFSTHVMAHAEELCEHDRDDPQGPQGAG